MLKTVEQENRRGHATTITGRMERICLKSLILLTCKKGRICENTTHSPQDLIVKGRNIRGTKSQYNAA